MYTTAKGFYEDFNRHRLKLAIVCMALGMFPFFGAIISFYIYIQSKYMDESRSQKTLRYGAILATLIVMFTIIAIGGNFFSQSSLLEPLMALSYFGLALTVATSFLKKWIGWASTAADFVNTVSATGFAGLFFLMSFIVMATGHILSGIAIALGSVLLWLSANVVWFGEGNIAKVAGAVEGVLLTVMYLFINVGAIMHSVF